MELELQRKQTDLKGVIQKYNDDAEEVTAVKKSDNDKLRGVKARVPLALVFDGVKPVLNPDKAAVKVTETPRDMQQLVTPTLGRTHEHARRDHHTHTEAHTRFP